jgi:hypothetical protein
MKNPFEYLADLYDYHFQYARWFVHRRLLFSDLSVEKLKEQNIVNLFENKDNENVGMMIKSSTIYGLGAGLGIAPLTYVLNTDIYKKSPKSSIAPALGVVAVCSKLRIFQLMILSLCTYLKIDHWFCLAGIGLAYGSLVNGISQYRGGKNDFKNHAIAALLTFPVTGFYAKSKKE